MIAELFAILVAAVGGAVGVRGDTWDKTQNRPNSRGWITLFVVFTAASVAASPAWLNAKEASKRAEREARLSYQALMDVYAPLSMWLDDFRMGDDRLNYQDYVYPPILNLDIYDELNADPDSLSTFAAFLSEGTRTPNGRFRNDVAEVFAVRYRLTQKAIEDAITAYGPHVSGETLDHLVALKNHSLFRNADLSQARFVNRECRGWVDQVAADLTSEELRNRSHCRQTIERTLVRMTRDPAPVPPFTKRMEHYHKSYCERVGFYYPYCAWAEQRGSTGFPISTQPSER